jgi:hypothetical protein
VPWLGLLSPLYLDSWSLFILSLDDVSKPEFDQFRIVICKYVLEFFFVNTGVGGLEVEHSSMEQDGEYQDHSGQEAVCKSTPHFSLFKPFQTAGSITI